MSKSFFFTIVFLVVGLQVKADNWIIGNPKVDVSQLSFVSAETQIKKLVFDNQTFYIVGLADQLSADSKTIEKTSQQIKTELQAQSANPDMLIAIHPTDRTASPDAKPWHVNALKYADLPPTRDGKGVIVGVLDTGVDYNHVALKNHMWKNPNEIPQNGIDDDQNGFVDDINGYNFAEHNSNPMDTNSHGTHCAGLISSDEDPSTGAVGVAPSAKVMAVKIIGSNGTSFLSDAAEAVKYAVDNGAKVLSNSWRVYKSWSSYVNPEYVALLKAAIEYAQKRDVIFVAAAGNETRNIEDLQGDEIYPLNFTGLTHMFGVAASGSTGEMASFTNWGNTTVHIAAPGVKIMSTVPGSRWATMSGTSMATPITAGIIARGLSAGKTGQEAMSALINTSDKTNPWAGKIVGGIVNIIEYLK